MHTPLQLDLILSATDFSDSARTTFQTAVDLASRSGTAIHLVHTESEDAGARRRYAPEIQVPEGAVRAWASETVGNERLEGVSFEPVVV